MKIVLTKVLFYGIIINNNYIGGAFMFISEGNELASKTEYEYYTIEYLSGSDNKWTGIGDNFFSLREYEFGQFSACGECWQKTGIHGTFDLEYAKEFCNKLITELEKGTLISNSTFTADTKARYEHYDIKAFRIRRHHNIHESEVIMANKY